MAEDSTTTAVDATTTTTTLLDDQIQTTTMFLNTTTPIDPAIMAAIKDAKLHGDTSFVIINAALVFFMTPGLGYFYSGMARSNTALSLILISFLSMAVVLIQASQNDSLFQVKIYFKYIFSGHCLELVWHFRKQEVRSSEIFITVEDGILEPMN